MRLPLLAPAASGIARHGTPFPRSRKSALSRRRPRPWPRWIWWVGPDKFSGSPTCGSCDPRPPIWNGDRCLAWTLLAARGVPRLNPPPHFLLRDRTLLLEFPAGAVRRGHRPELRLREEDRATTKDLSIANNNSRLSFHYECPLPMRGLIKTKIKGRRRKT